MGFVHSVREVSEGEVMHREVKRDTAGRSQQGAIRPHTLFVFLQREFSSNSFGTVSDYSGDEMVFV